MVGGVVASTAALQLITRCSEVTQVYTQTHTHTHTKNLIHSCGLILSVDSVIHCKVKVEREQTKPRNTVLAISHKPVQTRFDTEDKNTSSKSISFSFGINHTIDAFFGRQRCHNYPTPQTGSSCLTMATCR